MENQPIKTQNEWEWRGFKKRMNLNYWSRTARGARGSQYHLSGTINATSMRNLQCWLKEETATESIG
jgi:hypothetical protein